MPSSLAGVDGLSLPSPLGRSSVAGKSGHLDTLWGMRRSTTSQVRASWPRDVVEQGRSARLPWERMAELAATEVVRNNLSRPDKELSALRPPVKDVRVGRRRRPADFGVSWSVGTGHRGRSCEATSAYSGTQLDNAALEIGTAPCAAMVMPHTPPCRERRGSVPPIDTAKADEEAGACSKAAAVAALQRLFYEEMAKGGQDANGAAARALMRLSEAPQAPIAPTNRDAGAPIVDDLEAPPVQGLLSEPEAVGGDEAPLDTSAEADSVSQLVEPLAARPIVPRRPSPAMCRRRPRPSVRPSVRSVA